MVAYPISLANLTRVREKFFVDHPYSDGDNIAERHDLFLKWFKHTFNVPISIAPAALGASQWVIELDDEQEYVAFLLKI